MDDFYKEIPCERDGDTIIVPPFDVPSLDESLNCGGVDRTRRHSEVAGNGEQQESERNPLGRGDRSTG